jgi:hypothetical protein
MSAPGVDAMKEVRDLLECVIKPETRIDRDYTMVSLHLPSILMVHQETTQPLFGGYEME